MNIEKYRPIKYEEVIGQKEAINLIQNTSHPFYIFAGASGCGKTTCARILAKELCGSELGIQEYNASQDNGIQFVRDLEIRLMSKPFGAKATCVILDECHGLTGEAQRAFLKLLEEPPTNTHFIFCTTDKDKLLDTIISRSLFVSFAKLTNQEIEQVVSKIAPNWKTETIIAVAKGSRGNARNAVLYTNHALELDREPTIVEVMDYFSHGSYSDASKFYDTYLKKGDNIQIILELKQIVDNMKVPAFGFLDSLLQIIQDKQFEYLKNPKAASRELIISYKMSSYILGSNIFTKEMLINSLILNRKAITNNA